MATSKDYIEFVCEQLDGIENVTYRKMFGEYIVYHHIRQIVFLIHLLFEHILQAKF